VVLLGGGRNYESSNIRGTVKGKMMGNAVVNKGTAGPAACVWNGRGEWGGGGCQTQHSYEKVGLPA
jgi:hypothetical protein